jgi:hypothetical protein
MTSRTLATIAALVGLALAAAPPAQADASDAAGADAALAHPLSTDWLAATPLLPEPVEAPACRADDPGQRAARAQTAAQIARIRALVAADAARAPGDPSGFRVLGNRGYNYQAQAIVDPSLIEFEARRRAR